MKTLFPRTEDITRKWYLIDAKDKPLGRLATEISNILRGKRKAIFTPFLDAGDYVVVVNAKEVKLTGKKDEKKLYYSYTGFPGGLKTVTAQQLRENKPNDLLMNAVRGMIPKNRLGRQVIKKLKIYSGSEHPHEGQQPILLELN